jgi:hypothetical protein
VAFNHELAATRRELADPEALDHVVTEVVAEAGQPISQGQRESLALSLASGITSLSEGNGTDPASVRELVEELLPGRAKTFVVWLDHPMIIQGPSGRYCHFNWDNEAYRVRDYLGGRILHTPGRNINGAGLEAAPLNMSALEVWNSSKGRIQCLKRFGLDFPVTEGDRWHRVLSLLTESARQWRSA